MKDGKYNEQVYMPELKWKDVDYQLRYSPHSKEQMEIKGIDEAPNFINFSQVEIVEMEVASGKPFKVLARQAYDSEFDIVHVILLKSLIVKTVWLNGRSDKHRTLKNKSQFVQKGS